MRKIFSHDMMEVTLYITLGIQVLYYTLLITKIFFNKQNTKIVNNADLPVSVIICARNEAAHLQKNLTSILNQDYPVFEVIVVDDASVDQTAVILQEFSLKYPQLKTITIRPEEKKTKGKKAALQKGIAHATHTFLLMTDADCWVTSNSWIRQMTAQFTDKQQLVLGAAPYLNQGQFLHDVVDYETLTTLIQYMGFAAWKQPYMGVGRNIAYTQALYQKVGGFQSHAHIASGDDDLFVQEAVLHTQAAICLAPEARMYSEAPTTWQQWWNQKIRHYSTGGTYRIAHQIFLAIFTLSKALIYFIFLYLMLKGQFTIKIFVSYLLYISILSTLLFLFSKRYTFKLKWYKIMFLDVIYSWTVILQGLQSKLTENIKWK